MKQSFKETLEKRANYYKQISWWCMDIYQKSTVKTTKTDL